MCTFIPLIFSSPPHSEYYDWVKLVLTTAAGGAIGGLLSYIAVVYRENKKDRIRKKQECTKALLNTQMMLYLQMSSVKALEAYIIKIQTFVNKSSLSPEERKMLKDYMVTEPTTNNIVALPYDIFELQTDSAFGNKITVNELVEYYQKLAYCNKKYQETFSMIARHNLVTDRLKFDETISVNELETEIIFGWKNNLLPTCTSCIATYTTYAQDAFTKTKNYINLLGISKPIQLALDSNGNFIADIYK